MNVIALDAQDWQTVYECVTETAARDDGIYLNTLAACVAPRLRVLLPGDRVEIAGGEPDPLRDALVAVVEAIAEREDKPTSQVVEEFFSGYLSNTTEETE